MVPQSGEGVKPPPSSNQYGLGSNSSTFFIKKRNKPNPLICLSTHFHDTIVIFPISFLGFLLILGLVLRYLFGLESVNRTHTRMCATHEQNALTGCDPVFLLPVLSSRAKADDSDLNSHFIDNSMYISHRRISCHHIIPQSVVCSPMDING